MHAAGKARTGRPSGWARALWGPRENPWDVENPGLSLTNSAHIWQTTCLVIKSIARTSILVSLGVFALSGCSTLDAQEEAPEFSAQDSKDEEASDEPAPSEQEPSEETEEPSQQDPSKEESNEPTPEATPEQEEDSPDDPDARSCDDIKWGEELREGDIVTLGATKGYLDADGDDKVEEQETEVGMCQLHRTGKKCGMVFYARRT